MSGKKTQSKDTSITTTLIGAAATIIVAIIGVISVWIQRQPLSTSIPTSTPTEVSELVFSESFENANNDWETGIGQYNRYEVSNDIIDGKYQRLMSTPNNSDGDYGTVAIPKVLRNNFCLIFDVRVNDFTSTDSAIVVIARATNYIDPIKQSYYRINLKLDGSGSVIIDKAGGGNQKQGVVFLSEMKLNDKDFHTIKISFQNNELEIYDGATNFLIKQTSFTGEDFLRDEGEVRIGTELTGSNQNILAEFDNIYVYTSCP